MKYLLLLGLIACSSVSKKPEDCAKNSFDHDVGGKTHKLRICHRKEAKPFEMDGEKFEADRTYSGLYDDGEGEWLLLPKYGDILVSREEYAMVKKYGQKNYTIIELATKKETPSSFSDHIKLRHSIYQHLGTFNNLYELDGDPKKVAIYDFETWEIFKTFDDLDSPIQVGKDLELLPYYTSIDGGFIFRRVRSDGSKFYQVYSSQGEPISPEFDASKVFPFHLKYEQTPYKHKYDYDEVWVFFEKVDDKKDLYWPIFFDDTRYMARPSNFKGFRKYEPITSEPNRIFPDYGPLFGEFTDSKYLSDIGWRLPVDLDERFKALTKKTDEKKFLDYEVLTYQGVSFDSISTLRKRVYYYEDRVEVPLDKKTYKNKAELLAEIKELEKDLPTKLKVAKAAIEKRKVEEYESKKAKNENSLAAKKEFIDYIHKNGPNPTSLQTYYYDVGVYCKYGGPRCSSYQQAYRNMENGANMAAETRRMQVYNEQLNARSTAAPLKKSGIAQEAKDRFNSAVKHASDKEKKRVSDERMRKDMQRLR